MIPTGAITGRIFDRGQPARGVLVRAMRASFFDGRRSLAMADYARSDDLGEYRLFGLAPGSYYVISQMPWSGSSQPLGDVTYATVRLAAGEAAQVLVTRPQRSP